MAIPDMNKLLGEWGASDDPKKAARLWAEQSGYSPDQIAGYYNKATGSSLTGSEVSGNLGVDPSKSWQSVGDYWNSVNPSTGQHTTPYPTQTDWTAGSDLLSQSKPMSQFSDEDFYNNMQHVINSLGPDKAPSFIDSYMKKYGYGTDLIDKFNAGSGGKYNTSYEDAAKWLGYGGNSNQNYTDSADYKPLGSSLTLYGQDISGRGPNSSSYSVNSNQSNAYSGLDEANRNKFLDAIMPGLLSSVQDMSGNADKYSQNALELSQSLSDTMMKENIPKLLDQLAAKGIINSDMGTDALKGLMDSITKNAVNQTYDAGMQSAKMKYDIPSILGNLANIGKYSQSSGGGGSFSESSNTNTLAPYELLNRVYSGTY